MAFYGTEGGEFKASLLAGERFGERFSSLKAIVFMAIVVTQN